MGKPAKLRVDAVYYNRAVASRLALLGLNMSDLASDLGMSKQLLYKRFGMLARVEELGDFLESIGDQIGWTTSQIHTAAVRAKREINSFHYTD